MISESEKRMDLFREESKSLPPTKDEISKSFVRSIFTEALTPSPSDVDDEKMGMSASANRKVSFVSASSNTANQQQQQQQKQEDKKQQDVDVVEEL